MKVIRNTTEEDMVAAFLMAEINSVRWGTSILNLLKKYKVDRKIIDQPDLINKAENGTRAKVLGNFRGYKKNTLLFTDFPKKIIWKRVLLNDKDLEKVKYINYSYWNGLSGGTRLVKDAVVNIKNNNEVFNQRNKQFWKLAKFVEEGGKFVEIIIVKGGNGMVILEGHVRLTSYLLANKRPNSLEVIIGYPF